MRRILGVGLTILALVGSAMAQGTLEQRYDPRGARNDEQARAFLNAFAYERTLPVPLIDIHAVAIDPHSDNIVILGDVEDDTGTRLVVLDGRSGEVHEVTKTDGAFRGQAGFTPSGDLFYAAFMHADETRKSDGRIDLMLRVREGGALGPERALTVPSEPRLERCASMGYAEGGFDVSPNGRLVLVVMEAPYEEQERPQPEGCPILMVELRTGAIASVIEPAQIYPAKGRWWRAAPSGSFWAAAFAPTSQDPDRIVLVGTRNGANKRTSFQTELVTWSPKAGFGAMLSLDQSEMYPSLVRPLSDNQVLIGFSTPMRRSIDAIPEAFQVWNLGSGTKVAGYEKVGGNLGAGRVRMIGERALLIGTDGEYGGNAITLASVPELNDLGRIRYAEEFSDARYVNLGGADLASGRLAVGVTNNPPRSEGAVHLYRAR